MARGGGGAEGGRGGRGPVRPSRPRGHGSRPRRTRRAPPSPDGRSQGPAGPMTVPAGGRIKLALSGSYYKGGGVLTHTGTQRGRLQTACGQRRVDNKNSQTTPPTTSTSSIRQLLGAADAQTAHPASFSTAPTHQRLGSANAETAPARAPAAAADRTQRPDATCEGKNG